jgi:hypothetical protein
VLGGAALRGSAAPTGKKEITVADDLMIAIIDDDEPIRVATERKPGQIPWAGRKHLCVR